MRKNGDLAIELRAKDGEIVVLKEVVEKLKRVGEKDKKAIDTLEEDDLKAGNKSFDNTIAHIRTLNPKVELNMDDLNWIKIVVNREIVMQLFLHL